MKKHSIISVACLVTALIIKGILNDFFPEFTHAAYTETGWEFRLWFFGIFCFDILIVIGTLIPVAVLWSYYDEKKAASRPVIPEFVLRI